LPEAFSSPVRLRKRAEFLAVQKGEKRRGRYFLLEVKQQECPTKDHALPSARIGYTVSKKNGNAVKRNRIKRRLREAVRLHVGSLLMAGTDYVIVARPELLNLPFPLLVEALKQRVQTSHEQQRIEQLAESVKRLRTKKCDEKQTVATEYKRFY